ncbi:hypothetical protein [Lactococcus petauri]|uniref:hypothetical protein n=1 Tax=Lactococcus petauri TaxID=1940789 RepID=UPI001BCF4DE2|nr:hypothetical protein [Lactococcus petauri]MBS4460225.1 hypothetical protein [Lactococcus petauri]
MQYILKTSYPKEEAVEGKKLTERTFNEFINDLEEDEVIKQYEQFLTEGYSVSVTFQPSSYSLQGEETDPFVIARQFELAGISYKATLKLKASGTYEDMVKVGKMIEQQGYDYDISIKLKVNENSPVDFEKENSWFDSEFAKYSVLPKASSQDIMDLKSLYDQLSEAYYKPEISLKAKVRKDDDETFATQLAAYPEGTVVSFKLKDAAYI